MEDAEESVDRVMSLLSVDGDELKEILVQILAELESGQAHPRLASEAGLT